MLFCTRSERFLDRAASLIHELPRKLRTESKRDPEYGRFALREPHYVHCVVAGARGVRSELLEQQHLLTYPAAYMGFLVFTTEQILRFERRMLRPQCSPRPLVAIPARNP